MGLGGLFYIRLLIRRVSTKIEARKSVARTRSAGQIPQADSATVRSAVTISAVVRGMAIRFVRRKCFGKVWK